MEAVDYLHDRNLVHQDIKLENICLDNDCDIRLIDFEFCINDDDKARKASKVSKKNMNTFITLSSRSKRNIMLLLSRENTSNAIWEI